MATLNQLQAYSNELSAALNVLKEHVQNAGASSDSSSSPALIPDGAPAEAHQARRQALASVAKLQHFLFEPLEFVRSLATQTQILGCLQWLGEFHVLASIPLTGNVSIRDIADLVDVPSTELCRIVRMAATADFLQEPQPGYVAHTPLSAAFVTNPSHLDAVMFLAENVGPAALRMSSATQRHCAPENRKKTAYSIALNTDQTFYAACERRPKLKRQWPAYLKCLGATEDGGIAELLTKLDWQSFRNSCIVDVGARSTKLAESVVQKFPDLQFIVQLRETTHIADGWCANQSPILTVTSSGPLAKREEKLHPNITVSRQPVVIPQTVKGAVMYILHLDPPACTVLAGSQPSPILAELQAHLAVLYENPKAKLLLATWLLPETGTLHPDVEVSARLRDLSLMQLVDKRDMEIEELLPMMNHMKSSQGSFIIADKLRSKNTHAALLSIQYQPNTLFQSIKIRG